MLDTPSSTRQRCNLTHQKALTDTPGGRSTPDGAILFTHRCTITNQSSSRRTERHQPGATLDSTRCAVPTYSSTAV